MVINSALGAAVVTEIGSELLKKAVSGAGKVVEGKIVQNFGGENNPIDEKMDMLSSSLMDPAKRPIWDAINDRLNNDHGDGWLGSRSRRKMATQRRVNFAAMMGEPPTIKVEEPNDKDKGVKTTYTPDLNFKPLATKVKEYCVDMFLAEKQAQVGAGKSEVEAVETAYQKVEIYLQNCGFRIPLFNTFHQSIDDFLVRLPDHAKQAGEKAKAILSSSKARLIELAQRSKVAYEKVVDTSRTISETIAEKEASLSLWRRILRF